MASSFARVVLLSVITSLVGAGTANAASLTYFRFFQSHETDAAGELVDFIYYNSPLSTTDVLTGLTNSISFSDSTLNTSFDLSFGGVGSFDASLVLGAAISVSGSSTGGVLAPADGRSQMVFRDTVTLSGGTAGPAVLHLVFDVDGTIAGAASANFLAGNVADNSSFASYNFTTGGPRQVVFDIPFSWDQPSELMVMLSAFSDFQLFNSSDSGSAQFANTATLIAARALDENGQPVAGASITSSADLTYPTDGPAPAVPEPASLTLLAVGMTGMGARRWRHRNQ